MDQNEALRILQLLADGIDPHSGEVFDEGSPYQHPQVVRALFHAVRLLEQNGAHFKVLPAVPPAPKSKKASKAEKAEDPEAPELTPADLSSEERDRFERLRDWRAERARQLNLPQYVIAHNKHLLEMARLKDLSFASLAGIKGFGGVKAEKYAEEIQQVLED